MAAQTTYKVKVQPVPGYLHQVAGPRSLSVLERVTGESLRDLAFLRFRQAKIGGKTVDVARIGMSGNLAYEVRGPLAAIDLEVAEIGTEVIVQWGDLGRRIKNVRATVERFPYLAEGRNDEVDTAATGIG